MSCPYTIQFTNGKFSDRSKGFTLNLLFEIYKQIIHYMQSIQPHVLLTSIFWRESSNGVVE